MIQPPSMQREYSEFWTRDPAFIQPPEAPPADAAEDVLAQYKTDLADYARKIDRARETGQWQEILVAGGQPTMFTLAPISGQAFRSLMGKLIRGELTDFTGAPIAFRAAIRKIDAPSIEIKMEDHPDYGRIATVEITNKLDAIDPRIVSEIGTLVIERGTKGIRPL